MENVRASIVYLLPHQNLAIRSEHNLSEILVDSEILSLLFLTTFSDWNSIFPFSSIIIWLCLADTVFLTSPWRILPISFLVACALNLSIIKLGVSNLCNKAQCLKHWKQDSQKDSRVSNVRKGLQTCFKMQQSATFKHLYQLWASEKEVFSNLSGTQQVN